MTKTLYETLGISESATPSDIKEAYRRQAMKWHPDRNPDNNAGATVRFKEVAYAYKVLSTPEQRAAYDADLKAARASASGSDSSDQQTTQPEMSEEQAQQMFFEQMLDLAFELAEKGWKEEMVARTLVGLECPVGIARAVAANAVKTKQQMASGRDSSDQRRGSSDSKALIHSGWVRPLRDAALIYGISCLGGVIVWFSTPTSIALSLPESAQIGLVASNLITLAVGLIVSSYCAVALRISHLTRVAFLLALFSLPNIAIMGIPASAVLAGVPLIFLFAALAGWFGGALRPKNGGGVRIPSLIAACSITFLLVFGAIFGVQYENQYRRKAGERQQAELIKTYNSFVAIASNDNAATRSLDVITQRYPQLASAGPNQQNELLSELIMRSALDWEKNGTVPAHSLENAISQMVVEGKIR